MSLFRKIPPMVSKREFKELVPNRLLNGDHKLNERQWDHVKATAELLMDKDTPASPEGGISKAEVEEFGNYLEKSEHITFSKEQVERVKSVLLEHIK